MNYRRDGRVTRGGVTAAPRGAPAAPRAPHPKLCSARRLRERRRRADGPTRVPSSPAAPLVQRVRARGRDRGDRRGLWRHERPAERFRRPSIV